MLSFRKSLLSNIIRNRFNSSHCRRHFSANKKSLRIGLFGDIHFQEKGLDRIVKTGEWIIDEFKKQQVDAVVCLGE
jgi:hypothetical protein